MIRRPPRSTRTDTPFPYTTLFRSEGDEVRFDAEALTGALRQVLPAASGDDNRPILTGVLLAAEDAGLRLVATDSYRLAVRDLPGVSVLSSGKQVLVPSRAQIGRAHV